MMLDPGSLEAAGTGQSQEHGVTELNAAVAACWLAEEMDKVRYAARTRLWATGGAPILKEVWSRWNFGSGAGVVDDNDFATMGVFHPTLGRSAQE